MDVPPIVPLKPDLSVRVAPPVIAALFPPVAMVKLKVGKFVMTVISITVMDVLHNVRSNPIILAPEPPRALAYPVALIVVMAM